MFGVQSEGSVFSDLGVGFQEMHLEEVATRCEIRIARFRFQILGCGVLDSE